MLIYACRRCHWIGIDPPLGCYNRDTEYCPRCHSSNDLYIVHQDDTFSSDDLESFGKYSEKFQSMTTMKLKIIFLIFQSEQTVLRFGTGLMKSTRKELQNYQDVPNKQHINQKTHRLGDGFSYSAYKKRLIERISHFRIFFRRIHRRYCFCSNFRTLFDILYSFRIFFF